MNNNPVAPKAPLETYDGPYMSADELFFKTIQEACLPGVWSKGVGLARDGLVDLDSKSSDGYQFKVRSKERPVAQKVSLWPGDEDYLCDCNEKADPCAHVAAAVIAARTTSSDSRPQASGPKILYRFTRDEGILALDRWLSDGKKEFLLKGSLVAWIGGIKSGRLQGISPATTQNDLRVDAILDSVKVGLPDTTAMHKLIQALESCPDVFVDSVRVEVSSRVMRLKAVVQDESGGYRVKRFQDPGVTSNFKNGAVLCGTTLRPFVSPPLPVQVVELLRGEGKFFPERELQHLVGVIIPLLEDKIPVEIQTKLLPKLSQVPPRVIIQLQKRGHEGLTAVAQIVYGDPPIARVHGEQLELLVPGQQPARDPAAEKHLSRKLQTDLHLALGLLTTFEGTDAVNFRMKLKGWDVIGDAQREFSVDGGSLKATMDLDDEDFDFGFEFDDGDESGPKLKKRRADPRRVFQAWRSNEAFVPLIGGGYAPLPLDWLDRYGKRIVDLLSAREGTKKLPKHFLPTLVQLSEELNAKIPFKLKSWKNKLDEFEGIPDVPLPKGLKADLRHYQKQGVNWLCFLRESEMGALLADDMGLGKTLQALCTLKGKSLIIAPTSVMYSWAEQIEKFRPNLKYAIYHGGDRELNHKVDIVITTYAILRLDRQELSSFEWDTIVLDEAQSIKNPESQSAHAAFQLKGKFKIALSGTPIENRMEDLWSQFHFINPGLLGGRSEFVDRYVQAMSRGDAVVGAEFRAKIKPFLLRRLKKEVAPELPPRTEVVLRCELSAEEKEIYDSIRAATRKEVLEKLEAGRGVFAALEALLRMRQACCHPSLLPGQKAETSAKIELLIEKLSESIALGHKALVFSQWTSMLDLIEPQLVKAGLKFIRLDGSTKNRDQVVQKFQADDGPPVMLISLKAGGVGLTLTAADHIFIVDPWWNPAVEDQAADRAHRIGQKNPVLVHRLVAADTVEERIILLQKKKQDLATAVLQNTQMAVSLTREDLMELLK